jgi:hypothetical protein
MSKIINTAKQLLKKGEFLELSAFINLLTEEQAEAVKNAIYER